MAKVVFDGGVLNIGFKLAEKMQACIARVSTDQGPE